MTVAQPTFADVSVPSQAQHPQIPTGSSIAAITFTGSRREFFRKLLRGYLLFLPTLGFYRFWLITDLRRHLWGHTRIENENLEYLGTAKEVLLGFLMALAILAPVFLVNILLEYLLEEKSSAFSAPLIFILYAFAYFASYRARRYQTSRTMFRSVRFGMKGSGWYYAALAIKWNLLNILTIGLTAPWGHAALEKYCMQHTRFGDVQGQFTGKGSQLFKRYIWIWALVAIPVLFVIGRLIVLNGFSFESNASDIGQNLKQQFGTSSVLLLVLAALLYLLTYPFKKSIIYHWRLSGIQFGNTYLSTNLDALGLYKAYFKLVGGSFLFLFFLIAMIAPMLKGMSAIPTTAIIALIFIYLSAVLGISVIRRYYLMRGIWAVVASSIYIHNPRALDTAIAQNQTVGGFGEGLADALDIGASF